MEEIGQAIKELVNSQRVTSIFPAQVISVDEGNSTIAVEDYVEGIQLDPVKIRASSGGNQGFVKIPTVGSTVLVANIGKDDKQYVVLAYEQIDKILIRTSTARLEVRQSDFLISNQGESLASILADMMDAIKLITVPTPSGPSGVPNNAASFDTLKTRINNLLKSS